MLFSQAVTSLLKKHDLTSFDSIWFKTFWNRTFFLIVHRIFTRCLLHSQHGWGCTHENCTDSCSKIGRHHRNTLIFLSFLVDCTIIYRRKMKRLVLIDLRQLIHWISSRSIFWWLQITSPNQTLMHAVYELLHNHSLVGPALAIT